MKRILIWEADYSLNELDQCAARILRELPKPFCLWLEAPMGSGKTTLVGFLLRKLGLSEAIPVQSPTYTLVNEYVIKDRYYAHMDLYRARGGFSLDELGVRDTRTYEGFFIEWPEAAGTAETIEPTHILKISSQGDELRRFAFERIDVLSGSSGLG